MIDHRRPGGGLRGVLSKDLQITGTPGQTLTTATTTVVGSWVTMFGPLSIFVPIRNARLVFTMPLGFKHSVADASFGINVGIYENSDGSGAAESLMSLAPIRMPNAGNTWDARAFGGAGRLDLQAIPVGTRYIYVLGYNYNAGTLTFGTNSGFEYIDWEIQGH